jgi:UDP-N-acetylglucosamine diphosphorylase / glucose-1-phosphate thymidylyltransferase / UDP-N-acetylgalactosamine diphosphorylase / glucosamine-1-phosphate N-acetyltransferase / galactosamine-1-phosphate N-acetyltransferase
MTVTQGLIPAAGKGSRLGPFTYAIPKELLPVGEKAVIEHVVEAMTCAGIEEITLVVSPHKHGLSDYLGSGKRFGVHFNYVVQDEQKGLADAVLAGEHTLDDTFAVVLGDNYFEPKIFLRDMINFHCTESADTTVGVAEVQDVTRHGIINPGENRIIDIREKPSVQEAASNLGALGAYIFDTTIFDAIRKTLPGVNGEYQLTDSIRVQIREGKRVLFKKIDGIHIDVGTPTDLMRANERYLMNNRKLRTE